MSELEQMCNDLRTTEGIKRQLRGNISEGMRRQLEDLLYMAGRIDGLRDATERVAVQEVA